MVLMAESGAFKYNKITYHSTHLAGIQYLLKFHLIEEVGPLEFWITPDGTSKLALEHHVSEGTPIVEFDRKLALHDSSTFEIMLRLTHMGWADMVPARASKLKHTAHSEKEWYYMNTRPISKLYLLTFLIST